MQAKPLGCRVPSTNISACGMPWVLSGSLGCPGLRLALRTDSETKCSQFIHPNPLQPWAVSQVDLFLALRQLGQGPEAQLLQLRPSGIQNVVCSPK
ncbi:uncharacterized protein PgNI_02426 [Pyricularia grisea]|uniref:Uncharacterized protein n=1 Tax=Pyricularia grisea TaxID=148305 RepID=A0A6P8BL90_PYRGI|nr:uncharacterized protein PgNI_02426 [Pyricularia grisea]TLD17631.1 hypothetical protein PgNI_02426 [Pyricularia grisea]